MVSLFAFVMTAYGLNPYLVATFSSGLACENTKSQIIAAALEQSVAGTSTYSLAPRNLKCISTPGLVAGGTHPPEPAAPKPKTATGPSKTSRK